MESVVALHDLLDELHITSLDDSDVEVGLQSLASDDVTSGTSDVKGSFVEEPSTDSALSLDLRAALDLAAGDTYLEGGGESAALFENRLRENTRLQLPAGRPLLVPDVQQQSLVRSVQSLTEEQVAQARELAELRRGNEMREAIRNHEVAADAKTAVSLATGVFRLQMSDLTVSEAQYLALRSRPEDELNVREWVQLRFFEARSSHKAEAERLRLEVEALRENTYTAQTRAERAERQLAIREAKVTDLSMELQRQEQQARIEMSQMSAELKDREKCINEIKDKGLRFDEVSQEATRLRDELHTLREAMLAQTSAQQQLTKEHAACLDKLSQLEGEHRLLQKDAEAHERRARSLEETLSRRDEDNIALREKVASLREKKRELAQKVSRDEANAVHDVREQVDNEIKRFKDQARTDLDAVRTNLNALHDKEVNMLQERIVANDARNAELQRRLDDEEHAHQELQLSAARVRSELQNQITELRGTLNLRAFEAERATLVHQEISCSRQNLEAENEQLRQQVEVLKKEYYTLEVQHREGRATERAELASLKEQLKGYIEVERELDSAIRGCTGTEAVSPPQSIDEALLLGATLGGAPTSGQRRIQQSLLLAQEVQRRAREVFQCRTALQDVQAENEKLREELESSRREQHYATEPQAYLMEALHRREHEVLDLKRHVREKDAEIERSRKQIEHAVTARLQVEDDLKQLLNQRHLLDNLKVVLGCEGTSTSTLHAERPAQEISETVGARAEHRGRAPSQMPHAYQQSPRRITVDVEKDGPMWFRRLQSRLTKTSEALC